MKRITAILVTLVLILNSTPILFSSSKSAGISVKPFENIVIKLDAAIKNTASNLEKVKVAFDTKGQATEYGTEVTVNKKKTNELIIAPPSSGWRPNDKYFIVVEKGFEFAKNTKFKSNKVYNVSIKSHEYRTIRGTVKFDEGYKVTRDINIIVSATDFNDMTVSHYKKVRIPKGKNNTSYELKVPVNTAGYSIWYEIAPSMGFESFYTDCFVDIAYINQMGTMGTYEERKKFLGSKDLTQPMVIHKNKLIIDKANKIIKKVIKPGMSEYEKETAIFEYVIENIAYGYHLIDAVNYKSSLTYEALYNNATTCVGYASVMKLLLNLVGIECDVVGGGTDRGLHAWNIVKIDGEHYHLDATMRDYKYFNITDEQANAYTDNNKQDNVIYIDNDKSSTWPKCTSYKYNYYFQKYWKENNIKPNTTAVLKGTISLPNGRKAPAGGIEVIISAETGFSTVDGKDNLENIIKTRIPEGKNSKEFTITVIPNGMEYLLRSHTPDYEYVTLDEIYVNTDGKPIKINLKEPK